MDTAGRAERSESHTRQLLEQWRNDGTEISTRRLGDDCCFPLVVAGQAIGVLGVSEQQRTLTANAESVLTAAAALMAAAVRTAQLLTELRETAVIDPLTGCVNRAHFIQAMTAELRRTRRTGSPLSVLMVDLDRFKQLNDRHGHLSGDAALAAFARRTKELLRHSDVRCRYGGDEFLILLADTAITGALHVAEVLRREIEALDLRPSGVVRWHSRQASVSPQRYPARSIPRSVSSAPTARFMWPSAPAATGSWSKNLRTPSRRRRPSPSRPDVPFDAVESRSAARRDGRVVDGGGLENRCTRKGIGGSNPSPSATPSLRSVVARGSRLQARGGSPAARRQRARIPS
jgi:diguanylate cyclase (GGDEF)-like protein